MVARPDHISSDIALRRSGLLNVTQPTAPSFSASILSVSSLIMVAVLWSDEWGSDDAALVQIGDRAGVEADVLQHFVGVLAEIGRLPAQGRGLRRGRHVDRLADHLDGAERLVVDRLGDAEMLDLRIVERLVDRIDRPA